MKALFLGIDIGTTVIKSVLFDRDGTALKLSKRVMQPDTCGGGLVSQDMDILWDSVAETISELTAYAPLVGEVKAVGITAMGDGLWMLDADKKPLGKAILWTDGRASSYIRKWKENGIIGASGRLVFSGSPLAFAAWAYDNIPAIMDKAHHVFFCKDWVKFCLTGEIVTDDTDMADASLIDTRARCYSHSLLRQFGMESMCTLLPPTRPSASVIGTVTKQAAQKTGLREGLPVANGAIDVAATAIGCGVIEPGIACSIAGTTIYNEICLDESSIQHLDKAGSSLICHASADRWLLSMGTMMGTPNLDWFLNQFFGGVPDSAGFTQLERDLQTMAPEGSKGVIFLPYLGNGGERAPFVKPSASAQFFGIKAPHNRYHMLRAVFEGVAFSMKDCYGSFPLQPQLIRLAGGGSTSRLWCQMFASCVGLPIEVTACSENGALGAAIMASIADGFYSGYGEAVSRMVKTKTAHLPDPEEQQVYENRFVIYRKLREQLWGLWDLSHEMEAQRNNTPAPVNALG